MGCLGMGVDPEIAKILATLDLKVEEYQEVFEKEAKEAKEAFDKQQKARKKKLDDLKNKNEKITEEVIKDLNKKELEVEIGFLANQLDKMHYIFTIGLELAEPIRKVTLDKLMEKAKSAPAITLNKINSQIEEIKNYPILDFLNSTYGKVLREALEKKGMSATILKGYKNKLFKERNQRRKVERDLYGIDKNEFDDETIDDLKLDLFTLVQNEYKDLDRNFREYARGKMVEAYLGSH